MVLKPPVSSRTSVFDQQVINWKIKVSSPTLLWSLYIRMGYLICSVLVNMHTVTGIGRLLAASGRWRAHLDSL